MAPKAIIVGIAVILAQLIPLLFKVSLSHYLFSIKVKPNEQRITHQEEIAPTKIEEDSPLTGKVVAMGLENELYDKRYLIVEGTDGKAHYLQASQNMVRQHDEGEYRNDNVVTISRDHFTNNDGEKISYLSVENHGTLDNLKLAMHSKLDDDTIEFVKTTSQIPQALYPSTCFGHEYAQAMSERFEEFNDAKLFCHDRGEDKYYLVPDWEQRYEQLLLERQQYHHELQQEQKLDVEQNRTREFTISF